MHTRRRRIQQLEQHAQPTHRSFEVWVGTGEDDMLGPNGEILSLAEFERRYPDAVDIGRQQVIAAGDVHARRS